MNIDKIEKRVSGRKKADLLRTDIYYNGNSHTGVIENICEHGLHLTTISRDNVTYFIPEEVFDLEVFTSDENKVNIKCEARWVHINKTPTHGLTYRIGMRIIGYASGYNDFKKLCRQQVIK